MTHFISLILMVLTSTIIGVNSFHSIPALLWSPERSMSQLPEVTGFNPIKADDLLKDYMMPLMDNPSESAVLFLQDQLHMDDFTKFADVYSHQSEGGAFKNIKSLMENHYSLELPQVINPNEAIEKLKASFTGDVHTVKSAAEVESLNLTKDKKILLIVHLDPVNGQNDQENALQQNDATVGAISRHLQKQSIKYSALFTGQSSTEAKVESVESHSNRHLLAEPSNYNGTFMNVSDGQIYVFLREAYLVMKFNDRVFTMNLTVDATIADNSTRNNETAEIRYQFNNTLYNDTYYNISVVTEARNYKDRWVMKRVYLDIEGGVAPHSNISLHNVTLSPGEMDFVIPILYSWHCTDMIMNLKYLGDSELEMFKGSFVRFTGYQVQPFNIQNNRFMDAQDCVQYFTTAIWMFLFSAIFLISILIFGVLMVLSLSTMDKYDDPKGKTITVAQATD